MRRTGKSSFEGGRGEERSKKEQEKRVFMEEKGDYMDGAYDVRIRIRYV